MFLDCFKIKKDAFKTIYWGFKAWMCTKPDPIKESLMFIFEEIR